MTVYTAKRKGRICVWPNAAIARAADTAESKWSFPTRKCTVWPTYQQAAANMTFDDAGGIPEWVPEGAFIHADFENGQYWADGAERAITDIFEHEDDWADWNPAVNVVPGTGLVGIVASSTDGPAIKAIYATTLLAGAEYVVGVDSSGGTDLIVADFRIEHSDIPNYEEEHQAIFQVLDNNDTAIAQAQSFSESDSETYDPYTKGEDIVEITILTNMISTNARDRVAASTPVSALAAPNRIVFGVKGNMILKYLTAFEA